MKIIQGNFGSESNKGGGKLTKAVTRIEDAGIDTDEAKFLLIVEADDELKVASDMELEKLVFILEAIKNSILSGTYDA